MVQDQVVIDDHESEESSRWGVMRKVAEDSEVV